MASQKRKIYILFVKKKKLESGGPPLSTKQIRSITILREIPFVVPFNTRVGILQGLLTSDKLRAQGDLQGFLQGPSIQLVVRRSHIYEDAFDKLRPENGLLTNHCRTLKQKKI